MGLFFSKSTSSRSGKVLEIVSESEHLGIFVVIHFGHLSPYCSTPISAKSMKWFNFREVMALERRQMLCSPFVCLCLFANSIAQKLTCGFFVKFGDQVDGLPEKN